MDMPKIHPSCFKWLYNIVILIMCNKIWCYKCNTLQGLCMCEESYRNLNLFKKKKKTALKFRLIGGAQIHAPVMALSG